MFPIHSQSFSSNCSNTGQASVSVETLLANRCTEWGTAVKTTQYWKWLRVTMSLMTSTVLPLSKVLTTNTALGSFSPPASKLENCLTFLAPASSKAAAPPLQTPSPTCGAAAVRNPQRSASLLLNGVVLMNTMTQCFNVAVENIDDMEAEGSHSLHSSGQTPENAEFSSEMRTDSAGCTKEEDKAVFEDIQEVNQSYQCVQPVEERPWRKSGADISDYFNYGFDEESWKAYCRKHARLQTFQSHIAKVTREQAKYEEEGSRLSSTSGRSSKRSGRAASP
ncbi:uncharacterized protein fip1l1a [Fundulus heteroclitus]|uniref:uncharacterized protein fip1l1a n=1 Tax=Fundulus heteroclitus TaxID=8078 RepID=UPI00165BACF6|nr:uncharacterized protein fip1l1a [Fundulus heteroclitus]